MAKKKSPKAVNKPAKPVSKGSAKNQAKKERGGLLSFLIVLIFLHALFATLVAYSTLKEEYVRSIAWVLPVMALVSLATIVAAVGMWYWKKWALTLFGVTCVIAMAVHLIMTGSLLVVFYDLLPFAILGYVINLQSKRPLFE